jgi:hypothetical protein
MTRLRAAVRALEVLLSGLTTLSTEDGVIDYLDDAYINLKELARVVNTFSTPNVSSV